VPEALKRNFEMSAHVILAEPMYIALQMYGYRGDGHELVNHVLTPRALASGRTLMTELQELAVEEAELSEVVGAIPPELRELLSHPENYTGRAAEKAVSVARAAVAHIH
jgi:adenylosuccinate lyase